MMQGAEGAGDVWALIRRVLRVRVCRVSVSVLCVRVFSSRGSACVFSSLCLPSVCPSVLVVPLYMCGGAGGGVVGVCVLNDAVLLHDMLRDSDLDLRLLRDVVGAGVAYHTKLQAALLCPLP